MTQRNDGGPSCSQGAEMSTQHTPGPWEIDGEYVQQSGHPDVGICDVLNMDKGGDKQWFRGPITEANAHLIAAAPDMYDALKSMREYLSRCPPHSEDRTGAEWGRMMDLSGAALNKAEGKS